MKKQIGLTYKMLCIEKEHFFSQKMKIVILQI
jgi:hypothetical protein